MFSIRSIWAKAKQTSGVASAVVFGTHGLGPTNVVTVTPRGQSTSSTVLLMKQPPQLESWLAYHLTEADARHFYLRIEDTPSLAPLLSRAPWDLLVDAEFVHNPHKPGELANAG